MKKYRKKPVVIEAVRWTGENEQEILSFVRYDEEGRRRDPDPLYGFHGGLVRIVTLEGLVEASPGDWIIRGVKGEFYPCRNDIFEASYEEVSA